MESIEKNNLTWSKARPINDSTYPTSRIGFCLQYSEFLNGILMFAGMTTARQNDLFLFKTAENIWIELKTSGKCPTERSFATSYIRDNYFFVFGGYGEKERSFNDCYVLFLDSLRWKQVFLLVSPEARHMTAMCSESNSKNSLFLNSGELDESNKIKRNRRSSPKKNQRDKNNVKNELTFNVRKSILSTNLLGTKKDQFSGNTNDVPKFYMFGGINMPSDVYFNDLWCFDFSSIDYNNTCSELQGGICTRISTSGDVI